MDGHLISGTALYRKNLTDSMALNTVTAYSVAIKAFAGWCADTGRGSLPAAPSDVALYLALLEQQGRKYSTISLAVAAIGKQHRLSGLSDPTKSEEVRVALKAAARRIGTAPKQAPAITSDVLSAILSGITGSSLSAHRDRCLLSLGFMTACRRSELSALMVSDLERTLDKAGRPVLLVHVRRGKTDQEGCGSVRAVFSSAETVNAVSLTDAWITAAALSADSPLFLGVTKDDRLRRGALTPHSIDRVIKRRAADVGIELPVSGHSLRRGFVTEAIRRGCSERSIMNQTGHRSTQTLRRYYERESAVADNAASAL